MAPIQRMFNVAASVCEHMCLGLSTLGRSACCQAQEQTGVRTRTRVLISISQWLLGKSVRAHCPQTNKHQTMIRQQQTTTSGHGTGTDGGVCTR